MVHKVKLFIILILKLDKIPKIRLYGFLWIDYIDLLAGIRNKIKPMCSKILGLG